MSILESTLRNGVLIAIAFGIVFASSQTGSAQSKSIIDELTIRGDQASREVSLQSDRSKHRTFPSTSGDTQTSCQLNEDNMLIGVNQTIGILSDLTANGFGTGEPLPGRAAETFDFACDGEITEVRWWGTFLNVPEGGGFPDDCTPDMVPTEEDQWTLRYWEDDDNLFPNNPPPDFSNLPIVEFTSDVVPVTRVPTELTIADFTEYEMTMVFPEPVRVEAGVKYHIEIFNNYEFNRCQFTWEVAPPGDGRAIVAIDNHPNGWDPSTVVVFDAAGGNPLDYEYCQTFESDPPTPNPPAVQPSFQKIPAPSTGCCEMRYEVRNRNCIGIGVVNTFYLAVHRGDADDTCSGLDSISPPPGYHVEFCEPWNDGFAVFEFTGGSIPEQEETFGMIRTHMNGNEAFAIDANNVVPANGIRMWTSQDLLGALCGTGTFGPLDGQMGDWGQPQNALCPFVPIPSMSTSGKVLLALMLAGAGVVLVLRSRSMRFQEA